ncbi:hypothetical protein NM897_05185 [Planococcus maritimus]|uniref:hypothetical protein n=1 Tax=Planococcus maritimus TaxID=192421 RepID=UPI0031394923
MSTIAGEREGRASGRSLFFCESSSFLAGKGIGVQGELFNKGSQQAIKRKDVSAMAKVCFGMIASLDGFINDQHGKLDKLYESFKPSDEINEEMARTGAVVMGRRTYDTGYLCRSL